MFSRCSMRLAGRCSKALSTRWLSVEPVPPPSSLSNLGYSVEPKWVTQEHTEATYREAGQVPLWSQRMATFFGVCVWTWILLGFYYESDHLVGHHPFPDPSKWTNKELGIPDQLELDE
ncbi:NDUFB2 [Bugula neritina]|uniref:NDUFB2 n=1 Tax=Bugula neritina TaxID=10212 RepID=A0A7J7ITU1_BUGNE|nr:NDUFB2 [Bugula neritina]